MGYPVEMQRRATEVSSRRKELQHKRTSLADERATLAHDNQLRSRVHDFAARVHAVIDTLDDTQKQQLLRLLIEDIRVTGWHVQIRLRIALDPPPPQPPQPTGPQAQQAQQAQQANRHYTRARCQPKTVCVPLVNLDGDSYRLRDHHARTDTVRRATTGHTRRPLSWPPPPGGEFR